MNQITIFTCKFKLVIFSKKKLVNLQLCTLLWLVIFFIFCSKSTCNFLRKILYWISPQLDSRRSQKKFCFLTENNFVNMTRHFLVVWITNNLGRSNPWNQAQSTRARLYRDIFSVKSFLSIIIGCSEISINKSALKCG